jgi:cell division protein FtsW
MQTSKIRSFIIFLTILLFIIGSIAVYSSSCYISEIHYNCSYYFLVKQIIGYFIGILIIFLCSCINSNIWKKYAISLFLFSLFLCSLVHFYPFGLSINGAKRWIKFGIITFQPIEILKPFYILYISYFLEKYKFQSHQTIFGLILISFITSSILILQPDFGQTVILLLITILGFISIQPKKKIIYGFCAASLISIIALALTKSYRIKRLLIFLDPWKDPTGSGFQIIQSLIAIINGRWLGLGIGCSKQKNLYLPMQHTDFIFSIICEEIGTIGGIIIIILFLTLFVSIILLEIQLKNIFQKIFLYLSASLIFLQSSINILVAMAALPAKGIGLPFISYGISSIIGNSILIGIIISFSFDINENVKHLKNNNS